MLIYPFIPLLVFQVVVFSEVSLPEWYMHLLSSPLELHAHPLLTSLKMKLQNGTKKITVFWDVTEVSVLFLRPFTQMLEHSFKISCGRFLP
jgi:hypothetical protein